MMYWNGDWNWGAWLAMTLMMVAVWGAIAWVVVVAIRGSGGDRRPHAQQILDERLARGEITIEEHADRGRALRAGSTSGSRA